MKNENKKWLIIARQNIIGIVNDEGLYVFDGIKKYVGYAKSYNGIIDQFEKLYPTFNADNFELHETKSGI